MELFLTQVWVFNRYTAGYFYYFAILQKQLSAQIYFPLLVKKLLQEIIWVRVFFVLSLCGLNWSANVAAWEPALTAPATYGKAGAIPNKFLCTEPV